MQHIPNKMKTCQVQSIESLQVDQELSAKLITALRLLRTNLMREAGGSLLAYHIFTNATLDLISCAIPRTKEELLEINGVGKAKLTKYGDRVLETIEATLKENHNKNQNRGSNDSSDSAKRKRDAAKLLGSTEDEDILMHSKGRSKKKTVSKQKKDATEPVETDGFSEPLNRLESQSSAKPQSQHDLELSAKLITALRLLRTNLIREAGGLVLGYHIFTNATLDLISCAIPRTKEDLLEINGFGKGSLTKYGDRVLETIEATLKEHHNKSQNSGSNDSSDSAKRRRDDAKLSGSTEDEDIVMHSTGRFKKKTVSKQKTDPTEPVETDGFSEPLNRLQSQSSAKPQSQHDLELSAKLITALRLLRTNLMREAGGSLLGYHIFTNATLDLISCAIPRTKEDLLEINGFGKGSLTKYGDRVLETIEATLKEHHNKSQNSGSNDSSDSAKRRRDDAKLSGSTEDEDIVMHSTGRFKKKTVSKQKTDPTEPVETDGFSESLNRLQSQSSAKPHSQDDLELSAKLITALRLLRINLMREAGGSLLSYHIFTNATLDLISCAIPRTKEELLEINGVGKAKLTKYGDRVLETIEATLKEHHNKNQNSVSNDSSDSAKRKRDAAKLLGSTEDEDILMHSTGRSKKKTVSKQKKDATEPVETDGFSEPLNRLQSQSSAKPQSQDDLELSAKLITALRLLRTNLMREAGGSLLAYHIFTNATLDLISCAIPRTKEDLLEINGVGKAKLTKYGDRVLETIEATVKEHNNENQNSGSNDSSDSAKRRRDAAKLSGSTEDEDILMHSTGRSKEKAVRKQKKGATGPMSSVNA